MPASSTSSPPDTGLANLAAVATWVIPGAGHLLVGHTTAALIAFVVIEGLFWGGLQLTGGMTFEYLDHELRTFVAPALAPEAA